MPKVRLTAPKVLGFKCPPDKAQDFLWDTVQPGLGVRATPAGKPSFVFQAVYRGKDIRITIGSPESWQLESSEAVDPGGNRVTRIGARERARELQRLIDQGLDPRVVRDEALARADAERAEAEAERAACAERALREEVTVAEAWAVYVEVRKARWKPRTLLDHQRLAAAGGEDRKRGKGSTVAGPLAPLMARRLAALNTDMLKAWLDAEAAERPSSAAHAYRLLRGFIRWAAEHPQYRALIAADAYRSKAVSEAVPRARAKDGDCLQREQLPAWFRAVRELSNPVQSAYLQALLLTGARRGEMAALRWENVDFQWGSLVIADKVDDERVIPLTPYVSQLLAGLPRRNGWVFSSPTAADGRLKEPRIPHDRALKAAGLPHVTIHGLRRSFGTLCEWIEMPSGIAAQIMGHKPSALAEKHYRRRPLDLLRLWHSKAEAWMLEQAGVPFDPAAAMRPGMRAVAAAA